MGQFQQPIRGLVLTVISSTIIPAGLAHVHGFLNLLNQDNQSIPAVLRSMAHEQLRDLTIIPLVWKINCFHPWFWNNQPQHSARRLVIRLTPSAIGLILSQLIHRPKVILANLPSYVQPIILGLQTHHHNSNNNQPTNQPAKQTGIVDSTASRSESAFW